MADLQKQFERFHDTIALKRKTARALLAEKRRRILDTLARNIAEQRKAGVDIPTYTVRNQGSYALRTGIKPLDGDYDIDVALTFDASKDEHVDPVEVKRWVYDAVKGQTSDVRMREPCVTVFYRSQGELAYHVDLAIHVRDESCGDTTSYLARGKLGSGPGHRSWEESDPAALIAALNGRFSDLDDRRQLRRVIRCLKRWKDEQFSSEGNEAPRGIALTICAYEWFRPRYTHDAIANTRTDDDRRALEGLVQAMLDRFVGARLSVAMPVPPRDDPFARMSDEQMKTMKVKLTALRDALTTARDENDPHVAADELAKLLGSDFPVPERKDAGARKAAIVTSGHSA